jgi:hypothetical protein
LGFSRFRSNESYFESRLVQQLLPLQSATAGCGMNTSVPVMPVTIANTTAAATSSFFMIVPFPLRHPGTAMLYAL